MERCLDRAEVRGMLETVSDYARFSVPRLISGTQRPARYLYSFNSGLDPQSTWYIATRDELLQAEREEQGSPIGKNFFDENLLSEEGTSSVGDFYISPDGALAAYTVSHAGSDWHTAYFRRTEVPFAGRASEETAAQSGGPNRLEDELKDVRYSKLQWTQDCKGVFYQRYHTKTNRDEQGTETDPARDAELYYHRVGSEQSEDILIVGKDPIWASNTCEAHVSGDGAWLFVISHRGTEQSCRVYASPLDRALPCEMRWLSIAPSFKYELRFVASVGNTLYFHTNNDAPNWKVVRTSIDASQAVKVKHVGDLKEECAFEDVVAEDDHCPMDSVAIIDHDKLLATYIRDVKHELVQIELKSGRKLKRLLPDFEGSFSPLSTRLISEEAFVSAMSFTVAPTIYRLAWNDQGLDPRALPDIHRHRAAPFKAMDLSAFETQQVFVPSDNVRVPAFVVRHKDTHLDGSAPAWLYFYGGFNKSMLMSFQPRLLGWISRYHGVLVWICGRGGGELGSAWHQGAMFERKPNIFRDVLAVANYVVENKFAAKGKIIINGASNGGLGVLAVVNRAPEGLISCGLADVAVCDQLRYHHFTQGAFWIHEFGSADEQEHFDSLYAYSPLHNVDASKCYPFVLLTTADHDDRVSPLHSFKMTAEMQYKLTKNANPVLLSIAKDAGHGGSNSVTKVLEQTVIKYCLAAQQLELEHYPFS